MEPIGAVVQRRARPAQRTYVGKGKLEELKLSFGESGAESVIVDDELDPAQQRYLENALDARVVDRTQLILDIFAQHAVIGRGQAPGRTGAARVQPAPHARDVAAPRAPRRRGRHARPGRVAARDRPQARTPPDLVAEAAAQGHRAATRDPPEGAQPHGDTDDRPGRLHERRQVDAAERAHRRRTSPVENQLFHTLDPTTRGFECDGRRYLVTDTVGFIRRLPHQLVEGFASTLEETLVADVILHVIDASAEEDEQDRQRGAVDDVLHEIGAGEVPIEVVLNKIDRLDALGKRRLANRFPGAPQVSALTGAGLDDLRAELAHRFDDRWERVRLLVPYDEGSRLSELYALGTPIERGRTHPTACS